MKQMEFTPKISIIVPVYNVEPYIERCIRSIINQTYNNIEVILVDDGSTDRSGKLCDEYARKDRRIRVIHKKNGGLVSARKAGIIEAVGEYVAYVDSDDWIDERMYEVLVGEMNLHGADIVTSGLYREYPASTVTEFDNLPEGIYDRKSIEKNVFSKLMYTGTFFETGINMHLYNKLYRRELVQKNQLEVDDEIRAGEDAALVYPCIMDANRVVILHKCFYHYCIRNNSIMAYGYKEEFSGFKKIYNIIKRKIEASIVGKCMLTEQLNFLMLYMFLLKEPQLVIRICDKMLLPFENVYISERLILYGSGKFGSTLYRYLTDKKWCDIVLWVDKEEDVQRGVVGVSKIKEIPKNSYDKIVIAVLVGSVAEKIRTQLNELGIQQKTIAHINIKDRKNDLNHIWERELET